MSKQAKIFQGWWIAVLALVLAGFAANANAQVPPARALFLDLETVFTQSAVGTNIRSQLEQMLADISGREKTALDGFKAREQALVSAASGRPGEEVQKDWDALQLEKEGNGAVFQLERTAVQAAAADARRKVNAVLNEIMQEILVERGANMVLSVAAVQVGGVDYDITSEVIARLDKRMPSLKVERPK